MRTVLIVIAVAVVFITATLTIYVLRTCREATEIVPDGYRPSASAYSTAFTDALWMQTERSGPMVIDTSVTVSSLFLAAATHNSRTRPGFLLATVAARSRELAAGVVEAPLHVVAVLREIVRADVIMKRYDADTMSAIYAESAPFGGAITGLDAAAQQLLGKPAALLDAAEAAFLVTLSWTTNRCDMARLRKRSSELLAAMRSAGFVDPSSPFEAFVEIPALPAMAVCHVPIGPLAPADAAAGAAAELTSRIPAY